MKKTLLRPYLWPIMLIGVIVPRRLRADWRQEWEAELRYREALLSMVLAAVGLYGVMSYGVSQRTHEIGIRMALGAQREDVLNLVLRQGVKLTLSGIAIGLAAAWMVTQLLTVLLYGVSVRDPLTFVGVSLLLMSVALLACYLPARRATRLDPMIALRHE